MVFRKGLVTDPDGKGSATGNAAHMGATITYTRHAITRAVLTAIEWNCDEA